MTYYLYRRHDGLPEVTQHPLALDLFPGYTLLRESRTPINAYGKVLDGVNLVPRPRSYSEQRRSSYPSVGEQLDMLWHAMNQEVIPRVEPFYSEIKAVKDKYPKPANNP